MHPRSFRSRLHESGSKIKLLMRWDVSASGLAVRGNKSGLLKLLKPESGLEAIAAY